MITPSRWAPPPPRGPTAATPHRRSRPAPGGRATVRRGVAPAVAAAVLLLAACAGPDPDQEPAGQGAGDAGTLATTSEAAGTPAPGSTPATGGQTASGTASAGAETVRTVRIEVEQGRVEPPPTQLDLAVGERLRLLVTADEGESVHAHGFGDLEVPVTPGEPVAVDLVGSEPGVYEVELHDPDLLLTQVAVR